MAERDYLQHGRRHSPNGSDPIVGVGATCVVSIENSTPNIHNVSYTPVWDTIYDNAVSFTTIGALPAGIGLDLNLTNGIFTSQSDGVWSFDYTFHLPPDATWEGKTFIENIVGPEHSFGPLTALTTNLSIGGSETAFIPGGNNFWLQLQETKVSTASPYNLLYVIMVITRLA